ncbi:MAG: hypothetical protein ACYC2Z_10055 [Candidatus Nanopelagicales bacterium]
MASVLVAIGPRLVAAGRWNRTLAVAYGRVSMEEQAAEGHSIEGQADKLPAYAALHGLGGILPVTENLDLSPANGRMFCNILGSFAQFYRDQLAENVRMGQAVREGRWMTALGRATTWGTTACSSRTTPRRACGRSCACVPRD